LKSKSKWEEIFISEIKEHVTNKNSMKIMMNLMRSHLKTLSMSKVQWLNIQAIIL